MLGYSVKETYRMTVRKFLKLYQHYKNRFDTELILQNKPMTYSQLEKLNEKNGGDGEWLP